MAGIWIINRDAQGIPISADIYVMPCKNEPHPDARDDRGIHDWAHGLAEVSLDAGATVLCWPCAKERRAEMERIARLKRLPRAHREWLASRGQNDWKGPG